MNKKEALGLLSRYLILILLGIPNLFIFYFIFTPLTVYPSAWLLGKFVGATLIDGNVLLIGGIKAQILAACVAGAAYYFLVILNLTTPIKPKKRVKSLVFLILAFLILNIIRIVIFGSLISNGASYFSIAHEITWYIGSTLLVIILWFVNVWMFKIKTIPVYTDVKSIIKEIRYKK